MTPLDAMLRSPRVQRIGGALALQHHMPMKAGLSAFARDTHTHTIKRGTGRAENRKNRKQNRNIARKSQTEAGVGWAKRTKEKKATGR
jgi:hypothetical protein